MSDQIDISATGIEAAWQNFCEAGSAHGNSGDIDLYDIDGMFETAQEMHELTVALRAALDAAEAANARKAAIIDEQLNRMAQIEQDLQEAREALSTPNRHAYKVGISVGKAAAEAGKARAVEAERERIIGMIEQKVMWAPDNLSTDVKNGWLMGAASAVERIAAEIRTGAKT